MKEISWVTSLSLRVASWTLSHVITMACSVEEAKDES